MRPPPCSCPGRAPGERPGDARRAGIHHRCLRRSRADRGDDLPEASFPGQYKHASTALAVDWTDVESFSRPPRHGTTECAGPEASWGHRTSNLPGPRGEMFFGYYHSAGTMVREETGPPVPELAREPVLPCHPRTLLELRPLPRDATPGESPRTTPGPASWPGTSSAGSALMTPTATTASRARRHGENPLPAPPGLDDTRPQPARILAPPERPPACCTHGSAGTPPAPSQQIRAP